MDPMCNVETYRQQSQRGVTLSFPHGCSREKSSRRGGFVAKFNSGQEMFSMPAGLLYLSVVIFDGGAVSLLILMATRLNVGNFKCHL